MRKTCTFVLILQSRVDTLMFVILFPQVSSAMEDRLKSLMQEKAKLLEDRDSKEGEVGKLKERMIENEEVKKSLAIFKAAVTVGQYLIEMFTESPTHRISDLC